MNEQHTSNTSNTGSGYKRHSFSYKVHLTILAIIWLVSVATLVIQVARGTSNPDTAESLAMTTLGLLYGMLCLYVMLKEANRKLALASKGNSYGDTHAQTS